MMMKNTVRMHYGDFQDAPHHDSSATVPDTGNEVFLLQCLVLGSTRGWFMMVLWLALTLPSWRVLDVSSSGS